MEATWPDIVGYRFEVLHTGVLRYLLESPQALEVAASLLGEPVHSVARLMFEPRVGSGRTKADLQFEVETDAGENVRVVVETKVDSNASIGQLEHFKADVEGGGPWRIVFFAVGYSAFLLPRALIESWGDGWVSIDAERWAEILRPLDLADDLVTYREAIERELEEQRYYINQARSTETWLPGSGRLASTWGCRVTWLHAVRTELNRGSGSESGEWLNHVWTVLSGHAVQFGREFEGWTADGASGRPNFYVEVVANADTREHPNGYRWLAVKVGGQQMGARQQLEDGARTIRSTLERLQHVGEGSAAYRPPDSWKTATIATIDLSSLPPSEAAALIRAVVEDLDEVARSAVAAIN